MVNTQGATDLASEFTRLSPADREALAAMGEGERPEKQRVHAFAVVVLPNGAALGLPDPAKLADYDVSPASIEMISNACHSILTDLQASKTANTVAMIFQAQAQAAMNAAQNQEIMEKLRKAGQI